MSRLKDEAAKAARFLSSIHLANGRPNVCIMSTPRSGSTWLLELVLSQPGFKPCSEPFDLRKKAVSSRLGLERWEQLNDAAYAPQMETYLRGFLKNRYDTSFKGLRPGLPHYRPITRRIAFKILFAGENRVDWLRKTLNANVVLLIRHPIPVSLSRTVLPRLPSFLASEFSERLTDEQRRLADEVVREGNLLRMAVLDWCLENWVPLQHFRDQLLPVSYEQLVLDPEPVLDALAKHLDLDSVDLMKAQLGRPSASTSKSTQETVDFLKRTRVDGDRYWLVDKWRPRISEHEERALMQLVEDFGVDVYQAGRSIPTEQYWY